MSLVECRYNPNHRMKPSKREIHEQKCPDRFKCKIKYKHCPYDPLELIKEEDYEEHILNCKSRPNITADEEEAIERAKALNDIATEQEQIRYARQKYYKNCVEEPEIPGLGKKQQKKNKKKQNKNLNKKFAEITKKESDRIAAMANKVDENEIDTHNLENFTGDQNFNLDSKEGDDKFQSFGKKNDTKSKESEKKKSPDKKNLDKNEINVPNNPKFYVYDPNDEDKDIGKYSANIINPDEIDKILGYAN